MSGIPSFFNPFVYNEIDLDADSIPASKVLLDGKLPNSLSFKSPFTHDIGTSSSKTGFMTGEGSSFPSVAEHFGWTHLLDCHHFFCTNT